MAATEAVLKAIAGQLAGLNETDLHRELQELNVDVQELNRQVQERSLVQQFKSLEAQRQQERAAGIRPTRAAGEDEQSELGSAIVALREMCADISDQELQMEIGEIHQRLNTVNTRLQQRQQALSLKQMLSQQPGEGFNPGEASPGEPDIEEKRQVILELLARDATRLWSPAEVRKALRDRGFSSPDSGTPVRNLLWRLAREQRIQNPKKGSYSKALPSQAELG